LLPRIIEKSKIEKINKGNDMTTIASVKRPLVNQPGIGAILKLKPLPDPIAHLFLSREEIMKQLKTRELFSTAILLSSSHVLVSHSCFEEKEGTVVFQDWQMSAYRLIDGILDPTFSHKRYYKILGVNSSCGVQPIKMDTAEAEVALAQIGLKVDELVSSLFDIFRHHPSNAIKNLAQGVLQAISMQNKAVITESVDVISFQAGPIPTTQPPFEIPAFLYIWTDSEGAKKARQEGIHLGSGPILALADMSKGDARRCGALAHYDTLIQINTQDLECSKPTFSYGVWQYEITSSVPKEAMTIYRPL
jgi:hypothetical protein